MNRKSVKVGIALLLIGSLFYYYIDIDQFVSQIKRVNFFWVLITLLLYVPGVYVSTLRWSLILDGIYNLRFGMNYLLRGTLVGGFFNNFLPSVGGDVYRFFLLNKRIDNRKEDLIASLVLDRGIGFLSLFLLNFLLIPFFYEELLRHHALLIIEFLLLCFLGLGSVLFLFQNILYSKLVSRRKHRFFQKIFDLLEAFNRSLCHGKVFLYSMIISLGYILMVSISLYALFLSIDIHPSFMVILLVNSIVCILSALPISLNNIGVTEGLYVFLFGLFSISPESSFFVALLGRSLLILISSFGGLIYWGTRQA